MMKEEAGRDRRWGTDVDGNRLDLFPRGPDRFNALIALIDGARQSLQLFFYIVADDDHGRTFRDALTRARARGVTVSMLVDGFGSENLPDAFFEPLIAAGGKFARFIPGFGRKYMLRNHQKLLIADRQRVMLGGCNIERDYFIESPDGNHWVDLMVQVDGPAVTALADYFDDLERWTHDANSGVRSFRALLRRHSQPSDNGRVGWVFSGPFARISPLTLEIRLRIASSRLIDIVAAYFAPTPGMIRRMGRMARQGAMRIITPSRSDNRTTIQAARHCYARLLRQGVRIAEYQAARLHMKLIIADDHVYIGSANFDIRSLFINAELMVRISDVTFAAKARTLVERLETESRPITLEKLDRVAGFWGRQLWRLSYYIVVTLDPTVTRRLLRRVLQAEREIESSFHAQ